MPYDLRNLEDEMTLIVKLSALNVDCHCAFTGDTKAEDRKELVGEMIRLHQVGDVLFTVKDGKQITINQQYQRAYGELL